MPIENALNIFQAEVSGEVHVFTHKDKFTEAEFDALEIHFHETSDNLIEFLEKFAARGFVHRFVEEIPLEPYGVRSAERS